MINYSVFLFYDKCYFVMRNKVFKKKFILIMIFIRKGIFFFEKILIISKLEFYYLKFEYKFN